MNKNYLGDDLDTYNSYHSETDPYKTQTTTSRMINDPLAFMAHARQQPPASVQQNGPEQDDGPQAGTNNRVANQSPETDQLNPMRTLQKVSQTEGASTQSDNSQHQQRHQQQTGRNLLTGPLINYDSSSQGLNRGDLLRNSVLGANKNEVASTENNNQNQGHSRVRRDDSDEREIDNDQDDDGVWVDDDEDDDNRQQSSDVNETSQYPEEEEEDDGQQDDASNNVLTPQQLNPPGVIGGPHGYELSPNDLMIYHG